MPGVGNEDHHIVRYALGHGPGAGLFQADLYPVERGAGPAEGKRAASLLWVVANHPRGDADRFDFGQGNEAAVFIPSDVGVVQRGKQDADEAGNGRGRDDVLLGMGMAGDGYAAQIADEVGGNRLDRRHLSGQLGVLRFGKVARNHRTKRRQLHFQRIDLVEGAHDGMHEIRIVNGVGHRLGEGAADVF